MLHAFLPIAVTKLATLKNSPVYFGPPCMQFRQTQSVVLLTLNRHSRNATFVHILSGPMTVAFDFLDLKAHPYCGASCLMTSSISNLNIPALFFSLTMQKRNIYKQMEPTSYPYSMCIVKNTKKL